MTETAWERELRCGDARVILGRRGGMRFAEGRGATAVAVASFLMNEIQTREECGDMLARVRARSGSIEGNAWDVSFSSDHGVVLSGLYRERSSRWSRRASRRSCSVG